MANKAMVDRWRLPARQPCNPVASAEQTERDHQALLDAVASGRVAAETGVWVVNTASLSEEFFASIGHAMADLAAATRKR